MKKKTVIIFSHYVKNSDSKYLIYTHNHAKEYVKKGYNVITFAPFSVFPIIGLLKKNNKFVMDGVTIYNNRRLSISKYLKNFFINFNGLFYFLSVIFKVKKIVKEEDVILFDAHNFDCEGYTAYLLKKIYPDIPTLITFHGSDLNKALSNKQDIKRLKTIGKTINYYVCVSDKLKKQLKKINIRNVKTIYNGIIFHKITEKAKMKKIISVGDLIPSKNFSLLIQSFFEFSKKYNNYTLEIIGEGYLKEDLQKEIKKYHLEKKVKLLGYLENNEVYKKLTEASIFILVSKPEGFGIVYPEAMYCGCITIGTKNEGIDGFIKDKVNGFLVNPEQEKIIELLEYIIKNNCSQIINKAKEDSKKLSWNENCNQYLSLIGDELK